MHRLFGGILLFRFHFINTHRNVNTHSRGFFFSDTFLMPLEKL